MSDCNNKTDLHICQFKGFICYVVSIVVILFCIISSKSKEQQALKEVINIDSQAITSLGVAAHTQANNSHLLIQILNELDGISNDKPLEDSFDLSNLDVKDEQQVDVTISQLKQDIQEIDLGIRSISSNNLFQRQSLELILSKLRNIQ